MTVREDTNIPEHIGGLNEEKAAVHGENVGAHYAGLALGGMQKPITEQKSVGQVLAARDAHVARQTSSAEIWSYQSRLFDWLCKCFTMDVILDPVERRERFAEEACELLQSVEMPLEDLIAMARYVYSREVGDLGQEIGGVVATLGALCIQFNLNLGALAETELERINGKVDVIREKQKTKPRGDILRKWRLSEGAFERDYRRASKEAEEAIEQNPSLFPAGIGHYSVESVINVLTFHHRMLSEGRDHYEANLSDMLRRAEQRGYERAKAENEQT